MPNENFNLGPKKLENVQKSENKEREKEIKKFLLIPISELTKEDLSTRCLNILKGGKIEYIFELFLFDERLKRFQGFSDKIVEQIHNFYKEKGFEFKVLNEFFKDLFDKILLPKVEKITELKDSEVFKELIKELNNPNFKYENMADDEKEYLVRKPVSKSMINKLKNLAEELPSKELSFFYKPNKASYTIEEKLIYPRKDREVYKINLSNFSQIVEKYFYEKLFEELKKPD